MVVETRFYLSGNFGPVSDELTAYDLEVEGTIPPQLCGLYVHNGPNPPPGVDPGHWFYGQGMLHGVALSGGAASWYRNRYVRTPQFVANGNEPPRDIAGYVGFNQANTHVIGHGGRILALVESQFPTEVTSTLDTVGPYDFGGKLGTAMTAHPKVCPTTGELHFYGYGPFAPHVTYYVADATGALVHRTPVDVPAMTFMHDVAFTADSVVFLDLPVVADLTRLAEGTLPFRWSDDYGARLGVLARRGEGSAVRWFDIEPCYAFHVLNGTETIPGQIEIDVVRFPDFWRDDTHRLPPTTLHRWSIDTAAGKVSEQTLDDCSVEFPVVDPRRVGLGHRYGYAVERSDGRDGNVLGSGIVKYDLRAGSRQRHDFGSGHVPDEAVFVPATADAGEDEGYLVGYVYDAGRDRSDLVILDATDVTSPPVAVIRIPQRVPHGFHGSWIPDRDDR